MKKKKKRKETIKKQKQTKKNNKKQVKYCEVFKENNLRIAIHVNYQKVVKISKNSRNCVINAVGIL
jgi:hypothetical protein